MKKTLELIPIMVGLVIGLTFLSNGDVDAKGTTGNYRIVATNNINSFRNSNTYNNNAILHVKNKYKHKNVYVWNKKHTKVLYNLKDFPNSYLVAIVKQTYLHNHQKSVYYAADINTPKGNSSRSGRVWHGYLTKGYNRNYKVLNYLSTIGFTNDQDYLNYIEQSPSQTVTRAVLKLFPNTKLSLKLSNIGQFNSDVDSTSAAFDKYYKDRISLKKAAEYLGPAPAKYNMTAQQRIAKIKQTLLAEGFTKSKRDSMRDYVIGIYMPNPNAPWEEVTWSLNLAKPL